MTREINRPYVVGVVVGMVNAGVGAHVYNTGKLGSWWNMLLLAIGVNVAIIIGSFIAHRVAEKARQEKNERTSGDG